MCYAARAGGTSLPSVSISCIRFFHASMLASIPFCSSSFSLSKAAWVSQPRPHVIEQTRLTTLASKVSPSMPKPAQASSLVNGIFSASVSPPSQTHQDDSRRVLIGSGPKTSSSISLRVLNRPIASSRGSSSSSASAHGSTPP